MKIIVGLGNPGKEYKNTRHNAGWLAVDKIIQNLESKIQNYSLKFKINKKLNAEICEEFFKKEKIFFVKPLTFMNESGLATRKIVRFFNCSTVQLSNCLWVIHDDLDLNLGEIKIVKDRGPAGHKGVQSIISQLKTETFVRFRIGITKTSNHQPPTTSQKDYVLGEFRGEQKIMFEKAIEKCTEAVIFSLENGIEKAMNKYN